MKRSRVSLLDVADWDNLAQAAHRAGTGKRHRPEVRKFFQELNPNLSRLRQGILSNTVEVGRSTVFHIRDPKPRTIHAPCFFERVLHHALMNHVSPVLDRTMIADTFACRTGKGSLAAIQRCQHHVRRFAWYTKQDVRQYFASINHDVLLMMLDRRFRSRGVLGLLQRIIQSHQDSPRLRPADRSADIAAFGQLLPRRARPVSAGSAEGPGNGPLHGRLRVLA